MEKALDSYLEGEVNDIDRFFSINTELAGAYYSKGFYYKAKAYYRDLYRALPQTQPLYRAGTLNNLGMVAEQIGQTDSARLFYQRALHQAERLAEVQITENLTDFLYATRDNLGYLEARSGNYATARAYYITNLRSPKIYIHFPHRQSQAYLRLAELNVMQGNTFAANTWLQRAKTEMDTTRGSVKALHEEWLLRLQLAASDAPNRSMPVKKLVSRYRALIERREAERQTGSEETFERLISLQRRELEQARQLETLARKQRDYEVFKWRFIAGFIALGLTALLIGGWSVVSMRNQRLRKAREQEAERNKRLELERSLLESQAKEEKLVAEKLSLELEMREQDIESAARYFWMQEKLTETFLSKLGELKNLQEPEKMQEKLKDLTIELQALKPTEEKTREMASQLTEVNADFHASLQERFPKLSSNDLELCSLIRLGLGANEQAMLRGVSNAGIRKARYRLTKRLGLESTSDLDGFIRKM